MNAQSNSAPALAGRRFAVVGLGKSGRAAVELLLSRGAQVLGFDEGDEGQVPQAAELKKRGVELFFGPLSEKCWHQIDEIVVSPGVPLAHPELKKASAHLPVLGEIELAYRLLKPQGPLVGITGTNGKSTTTALCGELFRRGGLDTFVGGNLGRPLSDALSHDYQAHVVELSSFQLEGIVEARFNAAAILNLTPDHIDRYTSHEAYGEAKARIFQSQLQGDLAVVNVDDPHVRSLSRRAKAAVFGFSMRAKAAGSSQLAGLASPLTDGSFGFSFDFLPSARFVVKSRALRGAHNLQNAMAAALLAHGCGVSVEAIQAGLDGFSGLAHRLESVGVLDGVEWINDSKATNVDSSVVALKAIESPMWLIAGGKGKGAPYAPLAEAGRDKVRGVLTIGADAKTIEQELSGAFKMIPCGTLEEAVRRARQLSSPGEIVLLSPACASYDQFDNFEHRGDTFKALWRQLER